jgi:RNA recognition motif-containing protein
MKLYVGNIPLTATEQDIKEHFSRYGAENAKIIKDQATGRSRGFGFIELPDENGQKAIDELNNTEFMGNVIAVNHAVRSAQKKMPERKDAWKYKHISDIRKR